jgi:hypothetical protein
LAFLKLFNTKARNTYLVITPAYFYKTYNPYPPWSPPTGKAWSARPQLDATSAPLAVNLPLPQTHDPAARFVVIGDAGTRTQAQTAVAQRMSELYQARPFNAVLVAGDNAYPDGNPDLFNDSIARPYQDLIQRQVKFYPTLGNHDVKSGFDANQLAYWGVPRYYNFKLGSASSSAEFWAIDSDLFTPEVDFTEPQNPVLKQQQAAQQLQWLTNSLSQSTAPIKVVYGHHPLFSVGAASKPKRAFQQNALAQTLALVLEHAGVDLYISGHEHHYEAPRQVNGVTYVVTGAAGKADPPERGGTEGPGLIKQNHFMAFEITPEGLSYQTISAQGQILDAGLIPRRKPLERIFNRLA